MERKERSVILKMQKLWTYVNELLTYIPLIFNVELKSRFSYCLALLPVIPARPKLLPSLVPQQLNLWMGNSKQGSSSGLHHDFHDNLYLLIKGKKRFVLFPPKDAIYLNFAGTIYTIHENGLITYSQNDVEKLVYTNRNDFVHFIESLFFDGKIL